MICQADKVLQGCFLTAKFCKRGMEIKVIRSEMIVGRQVILV